MVEAKKVMQDSRNPLYARTAAELDTIWMSTFLRRCSKPNLPPSCAAWRAKARKPAPFFT